MTLTSSDPREIYLAQQKRRDDSYRREMNDTDNRCTTSQNTPYNQRRYGSRD